MSLIRILLGVSVLVYLAIFGTQALITLQKKNDSTALGLCTSEDQVSCLRVYHAPHRYLYSPVENKVCVRMKERFVECSALESVESGFQAAVNLSRNEIRQWVQELEILH